MEEITDVFPVDAHMCACPHCNELQIIQNYEFKYFMNKQITGVIIQCNQCKNKMFVIKPE